MARHEFEVRFDARQVRRTSLAYLRIQFMRRFRWYDWLVAAIIPFAWWWMAARNPRSWVVWAVPVVLACLCAFLAITWGAYIRAQRERLASMKTPVAKVVAEDGTLAIASDLGSVTMPWSSLTEAFDGPEALYLQAGKVQFIALPTAGVDPAALQFIRDRVTAAARAGS